MSKNWAETINNIKMATIKLYCICGSVSFIGEKPVFRCLVCGRIVNLHTIPLEKIEVEL